jgi:pimeloyl-ACP methyl ester carboxylesterase
LALINSAGPFTEIKPQPQPDPFRRLWGDAVLSILRQPWANFLLFQYIRQPWVIRQTLEKVYLDKSAVTDQLVEEIYRPACDPGAMEVFASVFSTPQGEKVDKLLEQLTAPLLMLWGEADPWINARERGEKFREHYPDLTEYYLNAGHCPHDEVPQQVNSLMGEWILSKVAMR